MDAEELVRAYVEAKIRNDFDTQARLRHSRWYADWPQSGERIPNHASYRSIHEHYPGGMPRIDVTRMAGVEDRWVVTPSMTIQRIAGSGDIWLVEGTNTYAGGELFHIVDHIELLDGHILRETTYFAAPFAAPAWRAAFVELIPERA